MKLFKYLLIIVIPFLALLLNAQDIPIENDEIKIILLRHAEKETGGSDPDLSSVGKLRAERLSSVFPGIVPHAFYSTNFLRTKSTLAPWAKISGKEVIIYDPAKPADLVDILLQQKGKTIVVAGHSNTVPSIVNQLIGVNKYENLPETEFGKIFIISIQQSKASVKEIDY